MLVLPCTRWVKFTINVLYLLHDQATGCASQHYSLPVPSQDKLGGLRQKAFGIKLGMMGWGH